MRPSPHGQVSAPSGPRRRILAVVATLTVFGGLVGVTQTSNAGTERAVGTQRAPVGCGPTSTPEATGTSENADGAGAATGSPAPSTSPAGTECAEQEGGADATPTPAAGTGSPGTPAPDNGLEILGNNCDNSRLAAHTGFQEGERCVPTAFGELGAADQNPTLLIADAPRTVREGERFRLVVSTRNLVRDRFLPAGRGGYYLESSFLTGDGLVRGHFHTSCRMLTSTTTAAEPAPVPAFFVATEDGKGGREPDQVIVEVPGLPAGLAQCSSWAGDGSHRIPMMARANQIPALDSVRIWVRPAENEPPADNEPPAGGPGGNQPPADGPGDDQPPADNEPPAGQPDDDQPPAQQPDDEQQPGNGQQPDDDQPPAQQPDDEQQPGNGQQPGGQKPTPEKSAGTTKPSPKASEPTPDRTDVVAEPPARQTDAGGSGGGLALTGTNTITFLVGGVVLLIVGFALLYLARRRRAVRR
ncbi:LPXTG cell wall anchor domain-containing protein [Plantactinospora sp. B5E13]|uniref:LPXTG cell wall anchor domain-containing protein n=1 Tax=unclassified Plantactinospora TaxID=2631981 RepID=UPI00325D0D3A